MTGSVSNFLSLVSFGNKFLNTLTTSENSYDNIFRNIDQIKFIDFKKSAANTFDEVIIADSPYKWFEFLKQTGCKTLKLHFQSSNDYPDEDYKLSGFANAGGTWLIEAVFDNHSNYWTDKWAVISQKDEPTIWSIKYGIVSKNQPLDSQSYDLIEAKNRLTNILEKIADFAYQYTYPFWVDTFKKSILALNSDNPSIAIMKIVTKKYSLSSLQLLSSVEIAWVFGGMGSWNDWWFDSEKVNKVYNELTAVLYMSVINAIVTGINSSNQ